MDLYEIEGKSIFKKYNIAVPYGMLVKNVSTIEDFPLPCVIKSQVLSGKRGKAGGIKFADNYEELKEKIKEISEMTIYGDKVDAVLVEEKLKIIEEHYLGLTINPSEKKITLMYSTSGGMDIETLAEEEPDKLLKMNFVRKIDKVDLIENLEKFHLERDLQKQLFDIIEKLIELFYDLDLTTVEINPLVLNEKKVFIAADAKLVVDDNALFRQEDYHLIERKKNVEDDANQRAQDADLSYIELNEDGNIGLIAGGAGLGMATMDMVSFYGGKPFNFLDLGGGVTAKKTKEAMKLLLENPKIEGVIVNVFGGINNCETMAQGIKEAIEEVKADKVIVIKSRGHSQEEGWAIFEELGLYQVKLGTTDDAVKLLLNKLGVR